MGNTIGRRDKAKVMKINGETFKLKTPVCVWEVVKDYPDHVLLESNSVKQFGIRAKPLEPQQELQPNKVYFLIQLPKPPNHEENVTRRVQSGVHMSAKDRLECLMLSRRSVSDLSIVRSPAGGPERRVQVKMKLPKAQVDKLVELSKDEGEVAERIFDLYTRNTNRGDVDWPEPAGNQMVVCRSGSC